MKITIARECGCYGDEVGQVLADRLNVPLYNKKTLTELAKKKGILEHYPDYFGENPAGTLLAAFSFYRIAVVYPIYTYYDSV